MDALSLVGSLLLIVLVLVLTYYATRWYARRAGQTGSGKYIKVLDRTALGTGASVTIVRIGEKYYLLGTGEKAVSLLCELPDFKEEGEAAMPNAASFTQVLWQVVERAKTGPAKSKGEDGDDHP